MLYLNKTNLINVMGRIKRFLSNAFNPFCRNPDGINIDAVITLVGLSVWAICILGEAFGYATIHPQVLDIGQLLFGIGLGRASKTVT